MFNIADLSKEDKGRAGFCLAGGTKLDHRGAADCAPTILDLRRLSAASL
jgi:hypothetical protein